MNAANPEKWPLPWDDRLAAQLALSHRRDKGQWRWRMQPLDWCTIRFTSRRCGLEPFVFSCAWPPEAHSVQGCTGQQMWVWYRAAMDNPFLKSLGGHIYGSWVRETGCMSNNQRCGRLTLCWEAFLFCEVSFLPWYCNTLLNFLYIYLYAPK